MALPHPSFWMEASPDMPFVLKEEVVTAYSKLHSLGVIHGNPQLRNILICADGRVKLIDFGLARKILSRVVTSHVTRHDENPTGPSIRIADE